MHLSQFLPHLVGIIFIILMIGFLMNTFRQPQLVGYILAGVLIGPAGLALAPDIATVEELGALGVTLLLFFIGMEVSPRQLISGWKIAILGTLFQIIISVLCTWGMGLWLDWPLSRSILLGFVISLSSTAVVLKLLQDRGELDSKVGENVLLILLTQDLAVVPMLIIISLLGDSAPSHNDLFRQIGGGIFLLLFSAWIISRDQIRLPLIRHIRGNHEMQVFTALLICFGMAFISGILNLSAALGAFIGGMLVATAKETEWVHHALAPLHVVFVAIFFVSVGMLINIEFLRDHLAQILSLAVVVLFTNTFINATILRILDNTWHDALYSGALLSQIGEFSFIMVAVGLNANIITQNAYQMTIAVIAISLLASPLWASLIRWIANREQFTH
ncbi:MAG: cation:proton antiporter [Gammaproteobacteria bacterium]|nr:cation:proton antiporter [Gammaproteobacteria bacterium]MDH5591820.1 cation:proton antiporter [Gammaproteobacteria bacterium]